MNTLTAPRIASGTYAIDPTHSRIGFVARHAMVAKVRGSFNEFAGSGTFDADDATNSKLSVVIEAAMADGGIDRSLDTESLVLFCHALGFGFLLVDALELTTPDPAPWQALIAHLVDALGNAPTPEPITQKGKTP